MKAIDVKTCIGKQVIMIDHSSKIDEIKGTYEMKYRHSPTHRPVGIDKISPSGEWVFVNIVSEIVAEGMSPVDLAQKLVICPLWVNVSDFNEAGTEIVPGELPPKRFSIVDII